MPRKRAKPADKPLRTEEGPVQYTIVGKDGQVSVVFDKPVNTLVMTSEAAVKLATQLLVFSASTRTPARH